MAGDTGNTAKRIDAAAGGDEVLVCGAVVQMLAGAIALGPRRDLVAKGRQARWRSIPCWSAAAPSLCGLQSLAGQGTLVRDEYAAYDSALDSKN